MRREGMEGKGWRKRKEKEGRREGGKEGRSKELKERNMKATRLP